MARTDTLPHFLTDVADAIREKKGTQETIQASDFDTEIENLPSGADLSEYFRTELTSSTSTNNNIFTKIIKKIPAISIGSQVTSLASCFRNCAGLTNLDLSNFDTSEVTSMSYMFQACANITKLDLRVFNTSKVTRMDYMFSDCMSLTQIDMRSFVFSTVTNHTNMFGETALYGVPDNCEIIVADDTAKTWITDKFTRLTNVKTVAEYEAE